MILRQLERLGSHVRGTCELRKSHEMTVWKPCNFVGNHSISYDKNSYELPTTQPITVQVCS